MSGHESYADRCYELSSRSVQSPAEDRGNDAWRRDYNAAEAQQVQASAAQMSQRAWQDLTAALERTDNMSDFLFDLQRQANERRVEPSAAVSALKEAQQRLAELRGMRHRVSDQMAQAIHWNERPHEVMDMLWAKFPGMGERPVPPYGQIVRGI